MQWKTVSRAVVMQSAVPSGIPTRCGAAKRGPTKRGPKKTLAQQAHQALCSVWHQTIAFKVGALLSRLCGQLCETCKSEHTIVGIVALPDDEEALTPAQTIQIFWNVLILELVLMCINYAPPEGSMDETRGGGRRGGSRKPQEDDADSKVDFSFQSISIVSTLITGLFASVVTAFVVMICTMVFKWGNSRTRRARVPLSVLLLPLTKRIRAGWRLCIKPPRVLWRAMAKRMAASLVVEGEPPPPRRRRRRQGAPAIGEVAGEVRAAGNYCDQAVGKPHAADADAALLQRQRLRQHRFAPIAASQGAAGAARCEQAAQVLHAASVSGREGSACGSSAISSALTVRPSPYRSGLASPLCLPRPSPPSSSSFTTTPTTKVTISTAPPIGDAEPDPPPSPPSSAPTKAASGSVALTLSPLSLPRPILSSSSMMVAESHSAMRRASPPSPPPSPPCKAEVSSITPLAEKGPEDLALLQTHGDGRPSCHPWQRCSASSVVVPAPVAHGWNGAAHWHPDDVEEEELPPSDPSKLGRHPPWGPGSKVGWEGPGSDEIGAGKPKGAATCSALSVVSAPVVAFGDTHAKANSPEDSGIAATNRASAFTDLKSSTQHKLPFRLASFKSLPLTSVKKRQQEESPEEAQRRALRRFIGKCNAKRLTMDSEETARAVELYVQKTQEWRWRGRCAFWTRVSLAWAFHIFLYLVCCLLALTFGVVKFKAQATNFMLMGWAVAACQTYLVIEPLQVLARHRDFTTLTILTVPVILNMSMRLGWMAAPHARAEPVGG